MLRPLTKLLKQLLVLNVIFTIKGFILLCFPTGFNWTCVYYYSFEVQSLEPHQGSVLIQRKWVNSHIIIFCLCFLMYFFVCFLIVLPKLSKICWIMPDYNVRFCLWTMLIFNLPLFPVSQHDWHFYTSCPAKIAIMVINVCDKCHLNGIHNYYYCSVVYI